MNVLVLVQRGAAVECAAFDASRPDATCAGDVCDIDSPQLLDRIEDMMSADAWDVDAVAVCIPYGGDAVTGPTPVDARLVESLDALIDVAPLHVPRSLRLLEAVRTVNAETPVVLHAQTAFFARLPRREYSYGLDADLSRHMGMRRYGFQGVHHEAACCDLALRRRGGHARPPARIVSICLEPRPELAAVIGTRPVMVTGGMTPLEGLIGQTTCGDIDPGIVLLLAQELEWGPERINRVLSHESGLLGMVGRAVTWEQLFVSDDHELRLARRVVRYRIVQACGAAIAAMGGLDQIVFSGRYAGIGRRLGPWLERRLKSTHLPAVPWSCFDQPLASILSHRTTVALLQSRATESPDRERCGASVR